MPSRFDRPVWGGGPTLFGTGAAGFGTTWSYGGGQNPPDLSITGEPGRHTGRGPRAYQRTDDRIREDVCERLADHPDIDASEMEVHVANAEVTLDGSVQERYMKRMAEDVAESVPGVRDVHNRLRVQMALPAA